MQLRRGRVAVTNGSTSVYGVYVANVTGTVGVFNVSEGVTWGSGGVGICVAHDTVGARLSFYRASGPAPAPGDGIMNTGATKSASIASLASDSTPNFATELGGPGGPKLFTLPETGEFYSVFGTPGIDSLVLTAPLLDDTDLNAAYIIVRDFSTYFFWPTPGPGDVDLASILVRTIAEIDSNLYGSAKVTPTLAANWTALSPVGYWVDADRAVRIEGRVQNTVSAVPSTVFTLPAGYRPSSARRQPIIWSDTSIGVVEIKANGEVSIASGTLNVSVNLDGIIFRAEA